jgi:hypothetical protein
MPRPKLKLAKELSGVISREAFDKLLSARGGTRVYIPATVSSKHWLTELLGVDDATKLCKHFSVDCARGTRLDIPQGKHARNAAIDRSIDELDQSGNRSSREIARMLRVTQRRVHRRRVAREIGSE